MVVVHGDLHPMGSQSVKKTQKQKQIQVSDTLNTHLFGMPCEGMVFLERWIARKNAKQLSQNLCATERTFSLSQNTELRYAYWAVHDYGDTILHSSLPEDCLLQFEGKLYIGASASTCMLSILALSSSTATKRKSSILPLDYSPGSK